MLRPPHHPTPALAPTRLLAGLLLPACAAVGEVAPTDTAAGGDLEAFALGEVQVCAAPRPEVSRVEVGSSWGLTGPAGTPLHADGGGVALGQLDDDGQLDLIYGFHEEPPQLWSLDAAGAWPLAGPEPVAHSQVSAVDLDGDGLSEVVYAARGADIHWNEGDGGFTVQEIPANHEDRGFARSVVPYDGDGDGILDLFLPFSAAEEDRDEALTVLEDQLVVADGEGGFRARGLGRAARRDGFDAVPLDHDGDGDLDLYVVNDKGPVTGGNVLWEQAGSELEDASADCDCDVVHSGMGGSAGDFDGDGVVDLFLTATGDSRLLQGLGDGTFVDVTRAAGVDTVAEAHHMSWGSTWLDHDNDGLLDLFVAQGDLWTDASDPQSHAFEAPLDLLVQQADGTFEDQGEAQGLPRDGSWRGVLAWDLDADGVLDLVASEVDGPPRIFLSEGCTAAGWLAVDAPQGARVVVETAGGRQTAWPTWHPGFGAIHPPRAWFGLGAHEELERLEVHLPGGEVRVLEGPLAARRVIRLREAEDDAAAP